MSEHGHVEFGPQQVRGQAEGVEAGSERPEDLVAQAAADELVAAQVDLLQGREASEGIWADLSQGVVGHIKVVEFGVELQLP